MSWNFDKVYDLPLPTYPDPFNAAQSLFDGKYLWVTSVNSLVAIDFWGPFVGQEVASGSYDAGTYSLLNKYRRPYEEELDDFTEATVEPRLRQAFSVSLQFTPSSISLSNFNGKQIIWAADFPITKLACITFNGDYTTKIDYYYPNLGKDGNGVTMTGNSNIAAAGEFVFFTDTAPTSQTAPDENTLYAYDIYGAKYNCGNIPGKKQQQPRSLVQFNNAIYVTQYTSASVYKYVFGGTPTSIYVNRDPVQVFVGQDKLIVASHGSMISTIDTNDTVTHSTTALTTTLMVDESSTYYWVTETAGNLLRVKKTDKSAFYSAASDTTGSDYKINITTLPSTAPMNGIVTTPSFSYDYDGTTYTVPECAFLINATHVMMFRIPDALVWAVDYEVGQYSAVSTGPQDYMNG